MLYSILFLHVRRANIRKLCDVSMLLKFMFQTFIQITKNMDGFLLCSK